MTETITVLWNDPDRYQAVHKFEHRRIRVLAYSISGSTNSWCTWQLIEDGESGPRVLASGRTNELKHAVDTACIELDLLMREAE